MEETKIRALINQFVLEIAEAQDWAENYNIHLRQNDLAAREEYGRRIGYLNGLRRAASEMAEIDRFGTEIVPPL